MRNESSEKFVGCFSKQLYKLVTSVELCVGKLKLATDKAIKTGRCNVFESRMKIKNNVSVQLVLPGCSSKKARRKLRQLPAQKNFCSACGIYIRKPT